MTKKGPPIRRIFLGAAYRPSKVPHPRKSGRDDELATLRTRLAEVEAENGRLREALEIIANRRQCVDNLMSNEDVASATLAQTTEDRDDDDT